MSARDGDHDMSVRARVMGSANQFTLNKEVRHEYGTTACSQRSSVRGWMGSSANSRRTFVTVEIRNPGLLGAMTSLAA